MCSCFWYNRLCRLVICSTRTCSASSVSAELDCAWDNLLWTSFCRSVIFQSLASNGSQTVYLSPVPWIQQRAACWSMSSTQWCNGWASRQLAIANVYLWGLPLFRPHRCGWTVWETISVFLRCYLPIARMLSGIYLYSDNVDNVNEVEFSNMVLRHCPQLASFGYDRYTHSILGFPMLAKRITSRDTCIIARSKHVNGFLPILQHLRDNLANTKRVGRFRTIKTLALDRKLQNQWYQ